MKRYDVKMFADEPQEVESLLSTLERILDPEDWSRVRDCVTAYVEGRAPVGDDEHRLGDRSGSGRRTPKQRRQSSPGASGGPTVLEFGVGSDTKRQTEGEAELDRSKKQLRSLALKLALAHDEERRRIARGLHDAVGPLLALARSKLGQLIEPGACSDTAAEAAEIGELVDGAIGEIRTLTFELSGPVLHACGLVAALESLCEQLEKEARVQFRVDAERELEHLDKDLCVLLYRIVRELCSNVVRHAQARHAEVRVSADENRIRIVVADDGEGFDDPEQVPRFDPSGGFGLFSVQEMCDHVGGRLEIASSSGKGTRIVLSVPLR